MMRCHNAAALAVALALVLILAAAAAPADASRAHRRHAHAHGRSLFQAVQPRAKTANQTCPNGPNYNEVTEISFSDLRDTRTLNGLTIGVCDVLKVTSVASDEKVCGGRLLEGGGVGGNRAFGVRAFFH
jgi:hypothetical protein